MGISTNEMSYSKCCRAGSLHDHSPVCIVSQKIMRVNGIEYILKDVCDKGVQFH